MPPTPQYWYTLCHESIGTDSYFAVGTPEPSRAVAGLGRGPARPTQCRRGPASCSDVRHRLAICSGTRRIAGKTLKERIIFGSGNAASSFPTKRPMQRVRPSLRTAKLRKQTRSENVDEQGSHHDATHRHSGARAVASEPGIQKWHSDELFGIPDQSAARPVRNDVSKELARGARGLALGLFRLRLRQRRGRADDLSARELRDLGVGETEHLTQHFIIMLAERRRHIHDRVG